MHRNAVGKAFLAKTERRSLFFGIVPIWDKLLLALLSAEAQQSKKLAKMMLEASIFPPKITMIESSWSQIETDHVQ